MCWRLRSPVLLVVLFRFAAETGPPKGGPFFLRCAMHALHMWIARFACDMRGYSCIFELHRDFTVLIERWFAMAKENSLSAVFAEDDRILLQEALDLAIRSAERGANNAKSQGIGAEFQKLAERQKALRSRLLVA